MVECYEIYRGHSHQLDRSEIEVKSDLNVNARIRLAEIDLNEAEIDLNEAEIDLNEAEIDLNEREHFLKANLDRTEIDGSILF